MIAAASMLSQPRGGTTTELYLDNCLAAENGRGVMAGGLGAGNAVITVSNSTAVRNTVTGIYVSFGTVRAFGNTVTNNGVGIDGQNGTFESAGHNMVHGNTTETLGTIVSIAPM
jgi:hypothetical protein